MILTILLPSIFCSVLLITYVLGYRQGKNIKRSKRLETIDLKKLIPHLPHDYVELTIYKEDDGSLYEVNYWNEKMDTNDPQDLGI